MNVTCKSILSLPYAKKMHLLAGKQGLNNEIRWVHYLEEPKYTEWLKGGELIIISGLVTSDEENQLTALIMKLYEKNVSGVVVSLSFYIEKTPKAVIDLGNYLGLPIFEISANVRIVDLSKSICFSIFEKQKIITETEKIMLDILYGRRLSEKRLNIITKLGYKSTERYRVLIIVGEKSKKNKLVKTYFYEEEEEDIFVNLQEYLQNNYEEKGTAFITIIEDSLLWMINEEISNEEIISIWNDISEKYYDIEWKIGVSQLFKDIRDLKSCFDSAERAVEFSKNNMDKKNKVFFYDDMVDLRLFSYIDNMEGLKKMSEDILGDLLKQENKELLEILKVYIENDFNAKKTADCIYIHQNTFYYRLNKIEKIIKRKLDSAENQFIIMLALKIENQFEM
ncbi:PucR family transcriptional regulator [uncultured Clostridium sp.]|uniref:PucR family transcriptional regulator n=1 Tax=uncultured Clostridium sp. TaxID=59620 RepID=UPI0025D49850|nr:PucR family transcriptional regulator [uncultured Clostridium sp.]